MRRYIKKKNKKEAIKTQQVFTEHNQVFTKNEDEDWFPVSFQWIPINK